MRGRRVLVIGTFDPTMPRARQWLRLLDTMGCDVEVRNIASWGDDRVAQSAGSPIRMLPARARRPVAPRPSSPDVRAPRSRRLLVSRARRRVRPRPDRAAAAHPRGARRLHLAPRHTRLGPRAERCAFAGRARDARRSTRSPAGACVSSWSTRPSTPTSSRRSRTAPASASRSLWVGADESLYVPADDPGDDADILWYLTYIPLHGFETVAARGGVARRRPAPLPAHR